MSGLHPDDRRLIQELLDWKRSLRGDYITRTGNSIHIGSPPQQQQPAQQTWQPQQFIVKTEDKNYLTCRHYRADTEEEGKTGVKIAKPPSLRSGEQTWIVYPQYVPDQSIIWAAPLLYNGATDDDDNGVVLMDLNLDGRSADAGWFEITGDTANGDNRGLYDWAEVDPSDWTQVSGGRASTDTGAMQAQNSIEANNSSSGVQGNSWDSDGDIPTDNTSIELKRVRGNPVVWMTGLLSGTNPKFQYENIVDGECG